jgi:hypothetical protein
MQIATHSGHVLTILTFLKRALSQNEMSMPVRLHDSLQPNEGITDIIES